MAKKESYGIFYIFLLAFIVSVPISLKIKSDIQAIFDFDTSSGEGDSYASEISSQLPEIIYNDGKFSFSNDQIQKIRISKNSDFIVIDPQNEITDISDYSNSIILKQDKMVYNDKNKELLVFTAEKTFESFSPYFSESDDGFIFQKKKFFEDLRYFFNIAYPLFLIIAFLICSIKYLVWVFLISNVAFFIFYLRTKPYSIEGKAIFRISAFSVTAVALFDMLRNVFSLNQYFVYPVIISAIIHLYYLYLISENLVKK